jgi:hypothetical protein
MLAQTNESTIILAKVIRTVPLRAIPTPEITLTGISIWIMEIIPKTTMWWTMNPSKFQAMLEWIQKPWSSRM